MENNLSIADLTASIEFYSERIKDCVDPKTKELDDQGNEYDDKRNKLEIMLEKKLDKLFSKDVEDHNKAMMRQFAYGILSGVSMTIKDLSDIDKEELEKHIDHLSLEFLGKLKF